MYNKSNDLSKYNKTGELNMEVNGNMQDDVSSARPQFPPEGKVLTGIVKRFYEQKGYGFLLDSSNNEYFCHYRTIASSGFKNLARGQHVKFIGKEGPKGLYAEDVKILQV